MAAYLPKSKVNILETSGGELIWKKSRKPFKGPYIKTSEGKFFEGTNIYYTKGELIKPEKISNLPKSKSNNKFNILKKDYYDELKKIKTITTTKTKPTEKDYKIFKFTRYFTVRANSKNGYFEIDQDTYKSIREKKDYDWRLYQIGTIEWALRGDTKEINKNTLRLTEKYYPGISLLFTFLTEYKSDEPLPISTDQPYEPKFQYDINPSQVHTIETHDTKPLSGVTSKEEHHIHRYEIDENGNGWALEAVHPEEPNIRHKHKITNWVIENAQSNCYPNCKDIYGVLGVPPHMHNIGEKIDQNNSTDISPIPTTTPDDYTRDIQQGYVPAASSNGEGGY